MYKVFKVEGGYQVFWVSEDEVRIADGRVKPYPSRQNAYKRCKQLNDERKSGMQQEIKVKISAMRDDCKALVKRIEEDFGGIEIIVEDPLYEFGSQKDQRIIRFARKIWSEDHPKDFDLAPDWMPESPRCQEVLTKLAKYRDLPEARHISCKIGNEVLEGGEIC